MHLNVEPNVHVSVTKPPALWSEDRHPQIPHPLTCALSVMSTLVSKAPFSGHFLVSAGKQQTVGPFLESFDAYTA